MDRVRYFGMQLSIFIMETVHTIRYWLSLSTRNVRGVRILILHDRKVVLVAHWYAPWAWTLPGGGIEEGEEAQDAAVREALEETGIKVRAISGEVGTYVGRLGRGDQVAVYYTDDFEGSLALKPNLEIMARSWFDIDHLPPELSPANRRRIEAYREGKREERGAW